MYLLICVTVLGLFTLSGVSYVQMDKVFIEANKINQTGVPAVEQLDKTLAKFEQLNGLIWRHMATTDNFNMKEIEEKVVETHQSLTDNLKKYESLVVDDQDKALLDADKKAIEAYDQMASTVLTTSLENKKTEARDLLLAGVSNIEAVQKALSDHRAYTFESAALAAKSANQIKNTATVTSLVIAVSVLAAVLFLGLFITRNLLKQLGLEPKELANLAKNLADGNLKQTIKLAKQDKNSVAYSIQSLQDTLDGIVQSLNHVSQQHDQGDIDVKVDTSRFKGGYAEMTTGINKMVAGHIAQNQKAMQVVKAFGEGNFNVSLEQFPGKQAYINETIEQVRSNIQNLIADANLLATAAIEGKLSTRVDASKHQGDFRKIVEGVNNTLDAVIGPLNIAAQYVNDIAKGHIPSKITETYQGDFNQLKNNLNACIDAINNLIQDASTLANAADQGLLSTRANTEKHQGDFRKIIEGFNDTLDSVIGPLNVAATYVERISKGDIPNSIVEQYNGEFNQLKNNLNQCIVAIKLLVSDANMLANAAEEGRITVRADVSKHQGEFKKVVQGVNATLETIVKPIITVKEAVDMINNAATEISSGNTDLSARTEQQAASLEETSASMSDLANTVKLNAANAKQANELALEASNVAIKGGTAVNDVVKTMGAINESAQKIEDIISVIDGIAFQTNILALNAAVEAARAGEQGRGFAVVAGEVRNLAQRSSSAAKEIKELINDSVSKTSEGKTQVESAGSTMEEIVLSVKRVSDIIAEISAASNEQSSGINQVNNAITNMDETTQQNAALVEEAAAAAESLVEQANSLSDVVNVFKFTDNKSFNTQTKSKQIDKERRDPNSPMRNSENVIKDKNVEIEKVDLPKKVNAAQYNASDEWEEF